MTLFKMNILVCISCVPDTTSKISFNENNELDTEDLQFIIGPYEDYALSRAVDLKEEDASIKVSVLNIGMSENDPLLRRSLAVGADNAYRINIKPNDSNQVSNLISEFIMGKEYDLILMGKESIDFNSGIVHHLVASNLGYNSLSPVSSLSIINDNLVQVDLERDESVEKIQINTPVVLGCQEPIAEWKIPNMRGIMNARNKDITVFEKEFLDSGVNYKKFKNPEKRSKMKYFEVDDIPKLIDELNLLKL